MTFGLTPQGFNRERLPDSKSEFEEAFIAQFGDITLIPQSIFGQIIGILAKIDADRWENDEDIYYSQYPSTAEGVSLDYVVALNGIIRLPAEQTVVIAACTGIEGTLITEGALARQPTTNENFFAVEDTTITRNSLLLSSISVDALAKQSYNALINGSSYFYSLPRIEFDDLFVTSNSIVISVNGTELSAIPFNTDSQTTIDDIATALQALTEINSATAVLGLVINFDSDFVASNSIVATLNGSPLSAVPFNSDQATTISDLATAIQADSSVTSCTVTDTREITIVPVDTGTFQVDSIITTGGASQPVTIDQAINITPESGYSVTIDYIDITGGASQTTYDLDVRTPASINNIVAGVVSVINNSSEPVTATDNLDGTFSILADDSEVDYSLSVSNNMTIQSITSPVVFNSENYGEIPAPIGSLTEILTPISGWQSINNFKAGVTGREVESDAELRLRRQNSIRIIGAATVEAIRARLLQEVAGVTQALVFENKTMQEVDILVTFSEDFVSGNEIIFTINGVNTSTVTFSTNQLTTMQLLANELIGVDGISNATVGGTGNRELTVVMTQGYDIYIENIQITNGASQTSYTIQGGRVPKSFEAVVQGGTDEDIANKIWETKPAGINTFGNTDFTITDSQGDPQVISFSRPTPIYIWVTVDLTLNPEEDFPSNGTELVEQAIVDYGQTLNIGDDVLFQRVLCQIFNVTGIASGNMQIAATLSEGDSPSFGTSDITIGESQLAIFSLNRTDSVVV